MLSGAFSRKNVAFLTHCLFFGSDNMALHTLILHILLSVAQAAIHLSEIIGREDKHQFVLRQPIAIHIENTSRVATLTFCQISFKFPKLLLVRVDAAIEGVDLHLKSSDNLLLIGDLPIDHLESRQLCLHILTCSSQLVLRFCHLLFKVGLLMLEFANAFITRHGIRLALLHPFLNLCCFSIGGFLGFHRRSSRVFSP